jgi:hypothetical protein
MVTRPTNRYETLILTGAFVLLLFTHAWLVTRNWTVGFMAGHEFRQTQTALISHYIDKDNNFSLFYETPIVGKPWVSVLLEVPLYEWAVVGVKRVTGWPLVESARLVTLGSFYLLLPAIYLLLGRFELTPARRLFVLALVLACPVYIFYSRAFLMDATALMCSAWFLWGYLRMMEQRRWYWFVLATVAGTGAALIKSATLAVWLLPAAACSVCWLWREFRARAGIGALAQTVFWGLAGVIVPLGALKMWISLTDPIKAAHASAWLFTSANLSEGNWGLVDFGARFSPDLWQILMQRWSEGIMPPWLLLSALGLILVLLPNRRRQVAGVAGMFFLAQLLFPFAYAYQDYYLYSCAVFLMAGFGLGLIGLWEGRLPIWSRCGLLGLLPVVMLHTYAGNYYPQQKTYSDGGFPYTRAIRDFLPPEAVIVVAGGDWAAIVPYYAERRTLMIRSGLEFDTAYLERAFADLADEEVSALVLLSGQRENKNLIALAARTFGLEPERTFYNDQADVYCNYKYGASLRQRLRNAGYYDNLKTSPQPAPPEPDSARFRISSGLARNDFDMISPAPLLGRFYFGYGKMSDGEGTVLNSHPYTDLWLKPASDATRIEWEFGMISTSWSKEGPKTDGVKLSITGLLPNGTTRSIYERYLDPVNQPEDRGRQKVTLNYTPQPGEFLQFSSQPGASLSFDWSYWVRIEVK